MNDLIEDNLIAIRDRLLAFYSPAEADVWLHTPHPQLGGATAFDTIEAGRAAKVYAVLDRLESDAYL